MTFHPLRASAGSSRGVVSGAAHCPAHAETGDGERLVETLAQGGGGARVGVVELAGEPEELLAGTGVIVELPGLAQPLLRGRTDALGKMVKHVSLFVHLMPTSA